VRKTPPYEGSVFINCPFDSWYKPLMRALIFAVYDCGFAPRSALEADNASEVRFQKILRIISDCKFGIHDLARDKSPRSRRLPHFNMPLELGLFLGASNLGVRRDRAKQCLILDRDRHQYRTLCSDLAGHDIHDHRGMPAIAITRVRDWLSIPAADEGIEIPSGSVIAARYKQFERILPEWVGLQQRRMRELTYTDERNLVEKWLKENPWSDSSAPS
jgi:hypothetical protein